MKYFIGLHYPVGKLFLAWGVFLILCSTVWADIPNLINFQGILDSAGNPLANKTKSVEFSIYDALVGGATLWSETQSVTTNAGGVFNVILGSANPIPDSAFDDTIRYLGIKVGTDAEMTPRQQIVSNAYGYRVSTVDGASGGIIFGNTSIQSDLYVDGNVGIGTTSPGAKLDVLNSTIRVGSQVTSAGIEFYPASGGIPTNAGSIVGVGGSTNIAIMPVGNVGIGTTSPGYKLHVNGGNMAVANASDVAAVLLSGDRNWTIGQGGSSGAFPAAGMGFRDSFKDSTRMVIDQYGNVGIGTTSPENSLHIFKGSAGTVTASANAPLVVEHSDAAYLHLLTPDLKERGILFGQPSNDAHGGIIYNNSLTSSGLQFRTNGNLTRMVIDASGNVGIGTTSPVPAKLYVKGSQMSGTEFLSAVARTAGGDEYLAFAFDYDNNVWMIRPSGVAYPVTFSMTGTEIMRINTNGNVGIGTTAPSEKLHVVGNICATGTIGACSDLRYKTNLKTVSNPLEKVLNLKGVYFNWKKDQYPDLNFEEDRQIGFVAQELKEILPEVVSQGTDGFYSVDYGKLTPLLVEAIKEQQQTIQSLEEKLEKLEKKFSRFTSQTSGSDEIGYREEE